MADKKKKPFQVRAFEIAVAAVFIMIAAVVIWSFVVTHVVLVVLVALLAAVIYGEVWRRRYNRWRANREQQQTQPTP